LVENKRMGDQMSAESLQVAADVLEEAGWFGVPLYDDGELVIVVLDRGWVVVGHWYQKGGRVTLKNGRVVRRWGTAGTGLAFIAKHGPTDETELEPKGEIRFRECRGLPTFRCNKKAWDV
jgi:hypothetical protein